MAFIPWAFHSRHLSTLLRGLSSSIARMTAREGGRIGHDEGGPVGQKTIFQAIVQAIVETIFGKSFKSFTRTTQCKQFDRIFSNILCNPETLLRSYSFPSASTARP